MKLAILIDENLDNRIAKNYFKAISKNQIRWIYLNILLLESNKKNFKIILEKLIAEAEFKNGSTNPERFYCTLDKYSGACYETIKLKLHNATLKERVVCYLRTFDDVIDIGGGNVTNKNQEFHLTIPFRSSLRNKSEHRIEVRHGQDKKWATNFYIDKETSTPKVRIVTNKLKIADEGEFEAYNFPPNTELNVLIWQNGSGVGCNSPNKAIITDSEGFAKGNFIVPHLIGGQHVIVGKHRIDVRIKHSYLIKEAYSFLEIEEVNPNGKLTISNFVHGTDNGLVSFQLKEVVLEKKRVSVLVEMIKVFDKAKVLFHSVSAIVDSTLLYDDVAMRYEKELELGVPFSIVKSFNLIENKIRTKDKKYIIKISASYSLIGHSFSLTTQYSLKENEVSFLEGY